ncbi:MAG: cell division protein FtsQ/DivIB [Xanthomonadaceae bacterium]|nr:cell division protein FtsQ/DivIB [Xanthomonadaceae bacterium]
MTRKRNVRGRSAGVPARPPLGRRVMRGLGAMVVVGAVGALAFAGWHYRDALPTWPEQGIAPVQRVLVEGPFERVQPTEVEEAVLPHLVGGFFTVDLDAIRDAAEALPWVAQAQVVREWPDRVRIVVVEQQPAWRWGDDGLLNARAELFVTGVQAPPSTLPRLDGPPGQEVQLAQMYRELDARLANCAMRVAQVELDPRRSLRLTLAGGIVVRLGRDAVDARTERFCEVVVGALAARLDRVDYVDMRYTNGFAVGWRDAVAPADGIGG